MNDYWHIPRASLTPSSASSAVSSASSTQRSKKSLSSAHGKQQLTPTHYHQQHQRIQRHYPGNRTAGISGGRIVGGAVRRESDTMGASTKQMVNVSHNSMVPTKRGSRSSQGSDDSNNSTRSAASGSLLLTAANLERMTEIHRKQQQKSNSSNYKNFHHLAINATTVTTYNANLMQAAAAAARHGSGGGDIKAITGGSGSDQMDSIINIDPNLDFVKTKDMDTVSIASSMHFTMVNGEPGGSNKKTKKGLCDRGRQVSVLIISMSMIFLLLIMGMVYALEMRAREMPHS